MDAARSPRAVMSPYAPLVGQSAGSTGTQQALPPAPTADPLDAGEAGDLHGRSWLAAGMGLVALVGVTGSGRAEATAPPAIDTASVALPLQGPSAHLRTSTTAVGARDVDSERAAARPAGLHVKVEHTNDSMRGVGGLVPAGMSRPDGWADDDGWTAGFRLHAAATQGNTQWVASMGYDMLTQRGSYAATPGYQGLRQDLAEVALQRNTRVTAGQGGQLILDYGLGAGLQGVGPMGGFALQTFVHAQPGIFQGRLGPAEGLQATYTTGDVHLVPIVTAGAAISQPLDAAGKVVARQALQAVVPLGRGVTTARVSAGVEVRPSASWKLSATAYVDVASNSWAPLGFMAVDGARPGATAQVEMTRFKHVQPYAGLSIGGVRGEPNYYVGVSVSLGDAEAPRLTPLYK